MKTQRYHFSVRMPDGLRTKGMKEEVLHAYVPVESDEETALKRVKNDDPLWRDNEVRRHGLVDWYETIAMHMSPREIENAA